MLSSEAGPVAVSWASSVGDGTLRTLAPILPVSSPSGPLLLAPSTGSARIIPGAPATAQCGRRSPGPSARPTSRVGLASRTGMLLSIATGLGCCPGQLRLRMRRRRHVVCPLLPEHVLYSINERRPPSGHQLETAPSGQPVRLISCGKPARGAQNAEQQPYAGQYS